MVLAPNVLNPAPRCVDSAPMAAPRSTRPREQLPGGWGTMAGEVGRFASRRSSVCGFDVVGTHTGTSPGRRAPSDARSRFRDESGFGLVEVLVALLLLAVVSVPTAYALTGAMGSTSYARSRIVASQLANQAIEQVEALPFADVASGLTSSEVTASQYLEHVPQSTTSPSYWIYAPTGEVVPTAGTSATGPPLVPCSSSVTENGVTYTVDTYPMDYQDTSPPSPGAPPPMMRVASVVHWTFSSQPETLSDQTLLYPPASPTLAGQ